MIQYPKAGQSAKALIMLDEAKRGARNAASGPGSAREWIARRDAVVTPGLSRVSDVVAASAKGAIIVDVDGREYIDFAGGIGVMNVGHSDPSVVDAIKRQAELLAHTCFQVATYTQYVELCETLVRVLPHGERTKCLLLNSGAEAVENAIKIARQATGRSGVICYTGAFHGRTLLCSTLTSKVDYKRGCGPFMSDVYRLPFPRREAGEKIEESALVERELHRLRRSMKDTVAPESVAAIIIEIVQGESGFHVAPRAYIEGLREFCDVHGIVLIFDEVQSGFGRTGAWAAYEHFGVIPDLSTWAKSMGGGLPISCVIGRASIMDRVAPGTVGGTYGGNPIACAAALATIQAMERMDLNARAASIGRAIRERFERAALRNTAITDVRGVGAMVALEMHEGGDTARPAGAIVKRILDACVERGLLMVAAGIYGNVIRILCPLVITDEQLTRGLDILVDEIDRHTTVADATGTPAPSRT